MSSYVYCLFKNIKFVFFTVAIVTLVSMECTENSNVELLVDGKHLNSTTLHHPSNENLVVECRCTSGSGLPEWLFPNGTAIPSCHDISKQICTQTNETTDSVNLNFLPFKESHAGQYKCSSKPINITGNLYI